MVNEEGSSIAYAPGVQRFRSETAHWQSDTFIGYLEYHGTVDDFVAAGIAQHQWFAFGTETFGRLGHRRRARHFKLPDGRRVRTQTWPRESTCRVLIAYDKQEWERRFPVRGTLQKWRDAQRRGPVFASFIDRLMSVPAQ